MATDIKKYINSPSVQDKIKELLNERASQFVVSLLASVNTNQMLAQCEPASVLNAAMTAASLDLPINQNLGFAYIIPYNEKQPDGTWQKKAQFQMGYKGFIQLAQRTKQYKTINVTDVREGEIEYYDRLTGEIIFNWHDDVGVKRNSLPILGYVAYFELTNGFKKMMLMTTQELKDHGVKFSKTARKGNGLWIEEFDSMARKTVLKLLVSKYGPMTTELQKAALADQAVVKGEEEYEYIDNKDESPEEIAKEKERSRIIEHINTSTTVEQLEMCEEAIVDDDIKKMYDDKLQEITSEIKKKKEVKK